MDGIFKVKTGLRLRRSPEIKDDNIITVLTAGTLLTENAGSSAAGWLHVQAQFQGHSLKGYVSSAYVEPASGNQPDAIGAPGAGLIPEVHLAIKAGVIVSRSAENSRPFPLNEPNMPGRDASAIQQQRVAQLHSIVEYLDVEQSKRYQPGAGVTFCNIYAYDYCCRASVYMPRVWWSGRALTQLAAGLAQPVVYGDTVLELNANALLQWFRDFSEQYGWKRLFDAEELQQAANEGKVGIIAAQRNQSNRSGHTVAVVPENDLQKASRLNGRVNVPLQSQAGVVNRKYFCSAWYLSDKFREFGFWVHD